MSRNTILEQFGSFIDRYENRLDIIHPNNAEKIGKKFNSLRTEHSFSSLEEGISADKVFNAQPAK